MYTETLRVFLLTASQRKSASCYKFPNAIMISSHPLIHTTLDNIHSIHTSPTQQHLTTSHTPGTLADLRRVVIAVEWLPPAVGGTATFFLLPLSWAALRLFFTSFHFAVVACDHKDRAGKTHTVHMDVTPAKPTSTVCSGRHLGCHLQLRLGIEQKESIALQICCTMDNLLETEEDNCIVAKTVGCNHSFWLAKFGDSAAAWLLLATKGFFSFDGQLAKTSHHSAHIHSLMLSSCLLSSTALAYHQESDTACLEV